MENQDLSLFTMFERHAADGTTSFKNWCDFVAWLRETNPDKGIVGRLPYLSPEAYAEAVKPLQPTANVPEPGAAEPRKESAPKEKRADGRKGGKSAQNEKEE